MDVVDNYRLILGSSEFVPIVVGGMGVNISTAELALEACRLGGIGHISDAMNPLVSDTKFKTRFTRAKSDRHRSSRDTLDKSAVKFNLEELRTSQLRVVSDVMERKKGAGAIFINVMEKLSMGSPTETSKLVPRVEIDTRALVPLH
jgi:nitronate monooxygenase